MKTTPVTPADLAASVLAVPPLARSASLRLNPEANRTLIRHLESGGVRTLTPETTAALLNDGTACAVKYAIVRANPRKDDFLTKLIGLTDRSRVISGMGERPAIVHLRDFGLEGFTSGSVCVGPRGSMRLLELLKAQRYGEAGEMRAAYIALEDARDELSPIRVLHEAVTLAGIADMGPMLPMLSNLDPQHHARVRDAAARLLAHDRAFATEEAAA